MLFACPGFDPQYSKSTQTVDRRQHRLHPPVWFLSSAFDFYSSGQREAWSSSSWPSNEPFQGHTFLQGISGTVEFPGPCSHLSLPTSAWSTLSNSPTAWYCTAVTQVHVRVMNCESEQPMASVEGTMQKQLKPAILPKDSCSFSNRPAPLACLEGKSSGDFLRQKFSLRCLDAMLTDSTGYELVRGAQLLPWRLKKLSPLESRYWTLGTDSLGLCSIGLEK